uniref:Uncharacterized protein n=1 Tax=Euplotes crassus TaxID=5936 RepID=A0A7S3KGW6_EUPCR|mmetsp:Transcript_26756/g.26666  ORF Transcript_26756/g.26666 Transcript_26756/m.26666 type:complete len:127 (+) Transcript_26756:939-1319(+)
MQKKYKLLKTIDNQLATSEYPKLKEYFKNIEEESSKKPDKKELESFKQHRHLMSDIRSFDRILKKEEKSPVDKYYYLREFRPKKTLISRITGSSGRAKAGSTRNMYFRVKSPNQYPARKIFSPSII